MSDITTHLLLPYILASQAQKHVTHNEALRLLDAMVQLSVLDRTRSAPPASPTDGDRHIVASAATGLWAGWDLNIAFWVDGVWMRLVPRPGWLAWIADEAVFIVWNGSAWDPVGEPVDVSDAIFSLVNDADPTKKALFSLSGISTGTTRTFTLPNTSSELAILAGTQTFSGNKTFSGTLTASGTVTVSAAAATIGTATTTATYGMGTGATTTGVTKTVNLGTGGASGSTTVVNIGSATAGSGGMTVVNTPTVTFANAVTQVGMPQANLTTQLMGLGGATADSYNRLSMNTPAVLINNAGAGIEATVNKAAAGNDAAFAFKTGFSARALIGLLGNDDFSFKVSLNGSTFFDAIRIDRTSGRVELPEPVVLPALAAAPDPPPAGKLAVYARDRAGAGWLDVQRPSGRFFPLQPHFGVNRIATWAPSTSTTVNTNGMPRTAVGTVATPTLTTTGLADSMRRWRVTSAATASAVAEERSAGWVCWRGNAEGLGGWNYVNRLSLTTVQATGMGFFGLYGSISALATTLTLATVLNCIGIGFQRGTHTNWQLVHNDGAGAPTLIDLGASFPVASMTNVLTLYIARRAERVGHRRAGCRGGQRGCGRVLHHHRHARRHPTAQPTQPHEQRHDGCSRRLRLRGRLRRDRLLRDINMTERTSLLQEVGQAFRDNGLTAAITALVGSCLAVAATVTRKAFTNEAMLERLDRELLLERERIDKQRAEDRKADADRLERIETDIRAMRDVMFEAFQRGRTD